MSTRLSLALALAIGCVGARGEALAAEGRPNVLLIMADDLGFSDLGCYGSEIETPNLDRLAAGGLRFSNFYNTAKCHSSRISLLTGRYAFQAGNTQLANAVTSAEVLGQAGYFTAMCGKWHLKQEPTDFGFRRYFGHLSGATNYYLGDGTFRLNGKPWKVPASGFYATVANADHALDFLSEARQSRTPWFLYMAFNAPHAPLQPLEKDYRKYLGRYDAGWDAIRAARAKKQADLGLFGKTIEPCPRPDHIAAWDDLTEDRQAWESRRMAAYAALIDRVDQELGRVFDDLKKADEFENTVILFLSDNGACPFDRKVVGQESEPYQPETRWSDSTGWAWTRNTPFRLYKQNQYEGGISSPLLVHWPAGLKAQPGSIAHDPAHIVDILPSLAGLTSTKLPETWPGRELSPLAGISLAPALAGEPIGPRPPMYFLYDTDRGVREGDWKLVSFQSQAWELYNLAEDRTELHDLAAEKPELRDRLAKLWHQLAEKVDHAPQNVRGPIDETAHTIANPKWSRFEADRKPTAAAKAGRRKAVRAGQEENR